MKVPTRRLLLPLLLFTATSLQAEVRVPHIFGDSMVLQRDVKIPVWGWADPGEAITVTLGASAPVTTTASADGQWRVELPAQPSGGGALELTVKGATNTLTKKDILMGEVWLCSGQSNMEWSVASSLNPQKEASEANYPRIRHIKVPLKPASTPQTDFKASWQICSPDTVRSFTAAGYFMARQLEKELDVPVGLINASWGGTRIEPWVPAVGFSDIPKLKDLETIIQRKQPDHPQYQQLMQKHVAELEAWTQAAKTALSQKKAVESPPAFPDEIKPFLKHDEPTTLFNAMVSPYVGLPIRGAIWYQGESNHGEGRLYTEKMKALIQGWRKVWGQGDFPFYYVQIAPFQYGQEDPLVLPTFWEAQYAALENANTGIVTTTDISELQDIHPKNKQDVGYRLSLLALKHTYGKKDVVASGPVFRSLKVEPGKLRITFNHADGGLKARDGKPLDWFEIIGDNDYVKATATVEGDSIVLSSPQVANPTAVRFGWNKLAEPNLVNGANLPAYPFRAGDIIRPDLLTKVPDAAGYELLYDVDLSKLGGNPTYEVDNSDKLKGTVERIAWFLELRDTSGEVKYSYVSADGISSDLKKLGIPTAKSGAMFQTKLSNAKVYSNVAGLPTGDAGDKLNIEFWSHNYGPANTGNVANATDAAFDTGDQWSDPVNGYGSMQIHHYGNSITLLAVNNWNAGPQADLGIGNSTGQTKDWTFSQNASRYLHKRLRVLVKLKPL